MCVVNFNIGSKMKKVVQWYIKPDPFKEEHEDRLVPISNYAPWKSIKSLSKTNLQKMYHDFKMTEKYGLLKQRSFPIMHEYNTWANKSKETQIKFIDRDSYNRDDINIFPIQFRMQEDQIFTHPEHMPLFKLPDIAINFLKNHLDCYILFHDIFEAKALSAYNWMQIPGIAVQRKALNLKNPVMYINCQTNSKVHYNKQNCVIPQWLTIGGSHHWLEYPRLAVSSFADTNNIQKCLKSPDFKTGRFLFYGGRFRLARARILNRLLRDKEITNDRIFFNMDGNEINDIKKTENIQDMILGMYNANNNQNKIENNGCKTLYNENEIKELAELVNKMPFNNFPKSLKEKDRYHQKSNPYIYAPNPKHYRHIFVDISCETMNERQGIYNDYILFSEKIAKPLRACRPFICSANAGFYKELKNLGFKTFDKWWDESFDEDVDIEEHIDRITKTIKEVNSWSIEKCQKVFEEMKPTLIHNRKHLDYIVHHAPRSWIKSVRDLDQEWRERPAPKH